MRMSFSTLKFRFLLRQSSSGYCFKNRSVATALGADQRVRIGPGSGDNQPAIQQIHRTYRRRGMVLMGEVAPVHRRPVDVDADQTYLELGIRSFGRGVFEKPAFKGSELTWQKPYWLKSGDLLLSNIKAWEGAVAVVPAILTMTWVGSHRYITCLAKQGIMESQFLFYFSRPESGSTVWGLASPGTADRNRTLNTSKLANISVPVPDIELQKEFLELRAKLLARQVYDVNS